MHHDKLRKKQQQEMSTFTQGKQTIHKNETKADQDYAG